QYTATASVVVDFKPDPVTAVMYGGGASPAFMATQVDVITSERVAKRVVRNLRLNENPQVRQQWLEETEGKGSIETWLAELFQKNLDVRPSRESSVIAVSYKAPNPQFAAGLANAFVQAYLETTLELRVDPAKQYTAFFDARSKDARESLERAQSALSAFQKEKGIIANDERLDVENARLNELSSQVVVLQALASETASRQLQARGASADKMQEVLGNPLISGLKADLSRSEAKLQEVSARLGDNHPQVLEAKANIASLRSKVDAETARVTGGVGVSDTITRQREADVRRSLEAQRAKVLRLKAVRDEGIVLMRDVEIAQRAFETVVARFNQTSLESQNTQSNINVLTTASVPLEHSSPKLLLNTALAIFLGLLLAVGTALLLELMDRRVRSADDILAMLELPVLGVMPKPGAKGMLGGKQVSPMQQRLMAPLPPATKGA
ncbi:MAG: chain length determinant protein EpsF, partial [Rubrivivax sp.]|nr:chain length determinant protein EpsF [Rubrivivax sp.]